VAAEVAVRHLRKALQLIDRFGPRDQELRCELLLELAGAHNRAGEYASRDQRFAEAADAARDAGNGDLLLRAALGYGGTLPATVRPDRRAQALLEETLERLGEADSAARATVLARLAHWLHNDRPYPERREFSDRSLAMARSTGDQRTLATVLVHRGWHWTDRTTSTTPSRSPPRSSASAASSATPSCGLRGCGSGWRRSSRRASIPPPRRRHAP